MRKIFCNPLNIDYRYQFHDDPLRGVKGIAREAADPSVILYQGKYWLFASMTLGVWVSEDLCQWEFHRLPADLPWYDYAPDVRVVGEWVVVCASARERNCDYFRTKDILNGPWERIPGTFPFWDPNVFQDDDGRVYFYWGCSNVTPIWGVELDPETLRPLGERKVLLDSHPMDYGYERAGEDNAQVPLSDEEVERAFAEICRQRGMDPADMPPEHVAMGKGFLKQTPFLEGAWMTKHGGKYFLQYAITGTEYNVYADGVAVGDSPMGPFTVAKDNPYSLKLGGFIEGAGHGSTLEDAQGDWWKMATMRISIHHSFERRLGLWAAGFDRDNVLFCNQRYGDWPCDIDRLRQDPWAAPEWMLLSRGAEMTASSETLEHPASLAANEDVRTWWQADSAEAGQWLRMDLGAEMDVRAVQVNFADDVLKMEIPGTVHPEAGRYIDEQEHVSRWLLEGSRDGESWFTVADRRDSRISRPHDLAVMEDGIQIRYLRLTIAEVPWHVAPCISGLRVFGRAEGKAPDAPRYDAHRTGELDAEVRIAENDGAVGHLVSWGSAPDKLYHSKMTFDDQVRITSLLRGEPAFIRVDAWNRSGITEGQEVLEI